MKRSDPWYLNLIQVLLYLGILAAIIWTLDSCDKDNRKRQEAEMEEHDRILIEETEQRVRDEYDEKLGPLWGVLYDAYNPANMYDDMHSGKITVDQALSEYWTFYDDVIEAAKQSEFFDW